QRRRKPAMTLPPVLLRQPAREAQTLEQRKVAVRRSLGPTLRLRAQPIRPPMPEAQTQEQRKVAGRRNLTQQPTGQTPLLTTEVRQPRQRRVGRKRRILIVQRLRVRLRLPRQAARMPTAVLPQPPKNPGAVGRVTPTVLLVLQQKLRRRTVLRAAHPPRQPAQVAVRRQLLPRTKLLRTHPLLPARLQIPRLPMRRPAAWCG